MQTYLGIPSILAHTLNGGFLLLALVIGIMNFNSLSRLPPVQLLTLVLVISIAVGVHALSHASAERNYGYNPWKFLGF